MVIPSDLLDQLQAKDPETWKRVQSIRHFLKPHNSEAAVGAWLLYCIMRAIRARGWRFVLMTWNDEPFAKIYKNEICSTHRCNGYGNTEAEALLRAYLAAREASLEIRSDEKNE